MQFKAAFTRPALQQFACTTVSQTSEKNEALIIGYERLNAIFELKSYLNAKPRCLTYNVKSAANKVREEKALDQTSFCNPSCCSTGEASKTNALALISQEERQWYHHPSYCCLKDESTLQTTVWLTFQAAF